MSNLENTINSIPKLYKSKGCKDEQIIEAQKELNVKFAEEYVTYLKTYGAISFYGTEITGLNVDEYINVINVTLQEREADKEFPLGCIVIENTGFEGLLILQSEDGSIYDWNKGKREKIFNSLNEYIANRAKNIIC